MPETTQSWFKDVLLLTMLVGLMYSLFLGARPLSPPDEGRYSEIPREMVASGDYVTPRLNGVKYFEKPALFYWLQSVSIKAFGLHEWALRLMNALMAILGCLITYWGGRSLFDRQTGLISASILGFSLLYAALATFITLDMTVSTFLSGSFLAFLVGNRHPPGNKRRNYMWLMFAFAGFATLTKGLIGIIFPGMIIFTWLSVTRQWRSLPTYSLLSGTCLFLVITLPWHLDVQFKNPEFFHFYFIEQHFLRYFTDYADRSKPFWFLPAILLLGFSPWVGFLYSTINKCWGTFKNPTMHTTEIFLWLWAGLIFLFYWVSKSQLSPYILPIFTPLALLVGRYIRLSWNKDGLKLGFVVALIFSIIFGGAMLIYLHAFNHLPLGSIDLISITPLFFYIALIYYRKKETFFALAWMMASSFYLCVIINVNYASFDKQSIKPIALELAKIAKPNDYIYSFNHYFQDLPFYLERPIKVINWTGELKFGSQHQSTKNLMADENSLITEWPGQKRKFLIAKKEDLLYLKDKLNLKFYLVDTKKKYSLICNQEITK